MEWREGDHPRDDDGKFTDGFKEEPAREDFFKEDKPYIGYGKKQTADESFSFGKEIDTKIKKGIVLTDSEVETVFAEISKVYERPERGIGDKNLKKILDLNGFSNKPKKVNKKDLAKALSSGTIMYRGLNGKEAAMYAKQFYDGEMFVGIGLGGNGIYMSKDPNIAEEYTRDSNVTVVAIMPKDMRIAGKDVREKYKEFFERYKSTAEQTQDEKEYVWGIQRAISFGVYCVLKGYDAYLPTIKPETNMVVLNRSKLIIGKNNE